MLREIIGAITQFHAFPEVNFDRPNVTNNFFKFNNDRAVLFHRFPHDQASKTKGTDAGNRMETVQDQDHEFVQARFSTKREISPLLKVAMICTDSGVGDLFEDKWKSETVKPNTRTVGIRT